jgi:hypothetical protein
VGDVHAVADHEQVGAGEADMVGGERLGELARLVEKDGDADALRPRDNIRSRAKDSVRPDSGNVVDQDHVAPGDIGLDVAGTVTSPDDVVPVR